MKVVLLEDVKKVGKRGDIVDVSDGYARNYLIVKKLGEIATSQAINDVKMKNAADARQRAEELAEAQDLGKRLKEMSVKVSMKAGEGGKTFGSISTKEISKAAKDQLSLDIDKKKIQLKEPIKSLGTHVVKVKLHPKVTSELAVKVEEA